MLIFSLYHYKFVPLYSIIKPYDYCKGQDYIIDRQITSAIREQLSE